MVKYNTMTYHNVTVYDPVTRRWVRVPRFTRPILSQKRNTSFENIKRKSSINVKVS